MKPLVTNGFPAHFRDNNSEIIFMSWRHHVMISLLHDSSDQTLDWSVELTHWGRMTHICVSNLTNIGSDNGLSPDRRQAIIWTIARILLIGPFRTNFSEILIKILAFSFKKMHLKVSISEMVAILSRPQCVNIQDITWSSAICVFIL